MFKGHINIGRFTFYGNNAMRWAVNYSTDTDYICFRPTTFRMYFEPKKLFPKIVFFHWYFYRSPDATPSNATFGFGRRFRKLTLKDKGS